MQKLIRPSTFPTLRGVLLTALSTILLSAFIAAFLSGCAGLAGPREVNLPLAKLQAGVERRFPLQHKMLELFDIELTHPQLSLTDNGRVGLALDALVAPPFVRQSWRGSVGLSGRLFIDVANNAVMMAEPQLDRFTIDGVNGAQLQQLTKVANVLVRKVGVDTPVYQFKLEELRYAGIQFVPTNIRTTASGLTVTLEPVK